jgi:hypothetical protein
MRVGPLLLVLAACPAPADELESLAGRYVEWSADDLEDVREGRVVARVLDASHPKEVLCAALMRVAAPKARVLEWMRRPENLEAGDPQQSGRFGDPPASGDLVSLRLDASHPGILEKCRVGDCAMKLPAAVIERLRAEADWKRPGAAGRVEAVFKDAVLQLARDYWAAGDDALAVYADRSDPAPVRERLAEILATAPRLVPEPAPTGADGHLSWSKEKLWRRVVIRVAHVQVHEPSPEEVVLVSKLVFSNHFFEAGLSSTVYRSERAGNGGWLLFVSRLRCDKRGSGFSRLERGMIGMLVRRRLGNQWRAARKELEALSGHGAAP